MSKMRTLITWLVPVLMRGFSCSITIRNIKIDVSATDHIAILGAATLVYDARK